MKPVYIIGTKHEIQLGVRQPQTTVDGFMKMLRDSIKAYGVRTLAEEMNQEWAKSGGVEDSLVRRIAVDLGLQHIYCEADVETRKAKGIKKEDSDKREQHWLSLLPDSIDAYPILFICGSMHTKTFAAVLNANGLEAKTVYRNWPNSPDCRVSGPLPEG